MPITAPPTIATGGPVVASDLTTLLRACDDRLAVLYSSKTWLAYDLTDTPSHQIPPLGAVFVLSADADREILPAPGTPDPQGGSFNWPEQYVHSDHTTAADALTFVGIDTQEVAWEVSGTYAVDVYGFGDCPDVLERDETDGAFSGVKPLRLSGNFEPERFHRYALADVFVEDADAGTVDWPYDKFGVARFHNVSSGTITIDLGGGQTFDLGPWGIRTVRKLSRAGEWDLSSDCLYFPDAASGDLPMWDSDEDGAWPNWTLKSQCANPIFRQAIISSMFRPHALTSTAPGMFSATVEPVLPAVEITETLSELVAQHGTIEVIRTNTADPSFIARSVVTYDGTLDPTPSAWTDAGLTISLDNGERAAIVEPDPAFDPPDSGSWHWDIISRGSNLTGGIIVEVYGDSETERVLRPFFVDSTAADSWFEDVFGWETLSSTASTYQTKDEVASTWTPATGTTEPDWDGSWSVDTETERRSYRAAFSSSPYSLSAWNLWSDVVEDHLPDGGDRSGSEVVRGTILTALVLQETSDLWHADDDATFDNACPIDPVEDRNASIPVLAIHGQPIGLGALDAGQWHEPRWRVHVLPTIGYDPQRTWEACGFYGTEEIIWTPLHPAAIGSETLYHFRVRGAEGLADGAPWTWSYGTTSEREMEEPGSPSGTVNSGMKFWRVFAQVVKQSGDTTPKPGRPNCGPQPWKIRDHGWLGDQILSAGDAALGESWYDAKVNLYDLREIGGEAPGTLRDTEFEVGFQIRMTAEIANQLSALVSGITHVRPLGWERTIYGFDVSLLFSSPGWETGWAFYTAAPPLLQPFGCAHVYGSSNPALSALDDALDALGITRRADECPELVAQRSDTYKTYSDASLATGYGWDVDTPTAPTYWSTQGGEIEWCSLQDIADAIEALGWTFRHACFVQRVSLVHVVPGDDESVIDTLTTDFPPIFHSRQRIYRTELVAVPDDAGDYQLVGAGDGPLYFRLAPERPMRYQTMSRQHILVPADMDIVQIGTVTGATHDALNRQYGEFSISGASDSSSIFWAGTLIAPTGTDWNVLAVPWRDLLYDSDTSGAGPEAMDNDFNNVPLVLPDDTTRATWLSVSAGDVIDIETLAGSATPTFPDGHHTWELLILHRQPLALASL
jgi:hypothetical protein